jgi:hypothetical protein
MSVLGKVYRAGVARLRQFTAYLRKAGAVWRVAGTTALLATVASCGQAAHREMTDVTLETAKTKVMSLEQEIVGMLPHDKVVSRFAHDSSPLMRCSSRQLKWTGDAKVELAPGVDRDSFLDALVESMQSRDGWQVDDGESAHGKRRADLLHSDGTHLLVSFRDAPETLRVAGYSACFDFPEYEYGEEY